MKRLSVVLAAALMCAVTPSFATVLTFDNLGLSNGSAITNYGSRMTGLCTGTGQPGCVLRGNGFTPNIDVTYRSLTGFGNSAVDATNTLFWNTGYGDLVNVTYANVDGDVAEVTLTPQIGASVKLNSFDIAGYNQADRANQTVVIYNSDYSQVLTTLVNNATVHGAGPTHDSFTGLNIVSSTPIHIQYGPSYNIGIDNINFDQVLGGLDGTYQLRYLSNLDKGDSYISLTNAGTLNGFDPAGRICVNVYTFDPAEELISCCACPVTPNGLNSLSARNDLISNTLTPGVPTSITVKLVATAGASCNPSNPTAATVVRGMRAWATTLHLNTSGSPAVGYQATETPFSIGELSASELTKLTSYCGFIQANGSGFGICKSCRAGALGAESK